MIRSILRPYTRSNGSHLSLRPRPVKCVMSQPLTTSSDATPYRQQLKADAKRKKIEAKEARSSAFELNTRTDGSTWELTVGIEIHAQLNTQSKLFSSASTSSSDEPNSNIALCDVAYPGAQPIFQAAALLPALRAAIALNCDIQRRSSFDRKHYFYPDQPAGYQITQFYGKPHEIFAALTI